MRKNENVLLRGPIFFLSRYVNEGRFDVGEKKTKFSSKKLSENYQSQLEKVFKIFTNLG
jgi:hypothetical protein